MLKGRRVGTLTAGVVFVAFGILLLIHTIFKTIDYTMIFKFWPVIIILLGIEILFSYIFNRQEKLRFDGGSIALMIILTIFASCMGFMQFLIENYPHFSAYFY